MSSIFNLFSLSPLNSKSFKDEDNSTCTSKQDKSTSNIFIETLKDKYFDIWNDLYRYQLRKHQTYVLLFPYNANILIDKIPSKELIMNSILIQTNNSNEYINLHGHRIVFLGNQLMCDDKMIRMISIDIPTFETNELNFIIYYVNRTFQGCYFIPEYEDDVTDIVFNSYIQYIRSFSPDISKLFHRIDYFCIEYSKNYIEEDYIHLNSSIHSIWNHTLNSILDYNIKLPWLNEEDKYKIVLSSNESFKSNEDYEMIDVFGQLIENYIMTILSSLLYKNICGTLASNNEKYLYTVKKLSSWTQTDFNIPMEFQVYHTDIVQYLIDELPRALKPIDKLIIFKNSIIKIRYNIENNIKLKFYESSLELATDDIITILIYILIQVSLQYEYIYYDINFTLKYHFVSSSKSEIGFCLNHFLVAVTFLLSKNHELVSYYKDDMKEKRSSGTLTLDNVLNDFEESEFNISKVKVQDSIYTFSEGLLSSDFDATFGGMCQTAANAIEDYISEVSPFDQSIFSASNTEDANEANEASQIDVSDYSIGKSFSNGSSSKICIHTSSSESLFQVSYDEFDSMLLKNEMTQVLTDTKSADKNSNSSLDENTGITKTISHISIESNVDSDLGTHIYTFHHDNSFDEDIEHIQILPDDSNKPCSILSVVSNSKFYAAITSSRQLYTWGESDTGRLGHSINIEFDNASEIRVPMPLDIYGVNKHILKVKEVACGKLHMIAVGENGLLYAWGDNRCAQLGISSSFSSYLDTSTTTSSSFKMKTSPIISILNENSNSEINMIMASSPSLIDALSHERCVSVACGAFHSLCLSVNGKVYSWGRAANGRLGQFPSSASVGEHGVCKPGLVKGPWLQNLEKDDIILTPSSKSPLNKSMTSEIQETGLNKIIPNVLNKNIAVIAISAGFNHSFAITSDHDIYSWGCGTHGKLGHGDHCDEYIPRKILAFSKSNVQIVSSCAGSKHSLFLTLDGILFGCGSNLHGQVNCTNICKSNTGGKRDLHDVLVPQPIELNVSEGDEETSSHAIRHIACGDQHSACITKNDRVYLWGKVMNRKEFSNSNFIDITTSIQDGSIAKQVRFVSYIVICIRLIYLYIIDYLLQFYNNYSNII